MTQVVSRFVHEETGANLIEYVLLAGLLSMACFLALSAIGAKLSAFLTGFATRLAAVAP